MEEEEFRILRTVDGEPGLYHYWCPGCECGHGVWTEAPNPLNGAKWGFNGDMEEPTFTPSIHVKDPNTGETLCHSYVTKGVIEFLSDCKHKLAGTRVPMNVF